jgi:hypothetical protein
MQHEAAMKINRTQVVPPSSQKRKTHRTAEVQNLGPQRHQHSGQPAHARYGRRANYTQHMSRRSPTSPTQKTPHFHRSGQEPVRLRLAKVTKSGMPQPFFRWRSGDRSGGNRRSNPRRKPHQRMRALSPNDHSTTMTGMKPKVVHGISKHHTMTVLPSLGEVEKLMERPLRTTG